MDPFIDENGFLRVGGRIEKSDLEYELKHPVILPNSDGIVVKLIGHFHAHVKHGGRNLTLNEMRSKTV